MRNRSTCDLLGTARSSMLAWGLPFGAMLLAISLLDAPKTVVWTLALAWMGSACLINARRCGRVHCRYTGPFLLAMILPVLGHGAGLVPLGEDGWLWLGLVRGAAWPRSGGAANDCWAAIVEDRHRPQPKPNDRRSRHGRHPRSHRHRRRHGRDQRR